MLKKKFSAMMLVLLLISMSVSVFKIQQVKAIASSPFYIPERVEVIPELPYPNDEVNMIVSFILNQANAEYTVTQEGNTFDIYVTIFRTVTPVVKRVVLNVSLGQLPIGSYQVNIKGVYYPKTIRFTVDFVHIINHFVEIYGYPFRIITQSNSTVSAFMFNLEEKQVRFALVAKIKQLGFATLLFRKCFLMGTFWC